MDSEKSNHWSSVLPQDCIDSANNLIALCELSIPRINSTKDINSSFIVLLFESITGYSIPDLVSGQDTISEMHNVQSVIDCLSLDLLGLSLSHITGESVISGDPVAISNLLEVLEALAVHLSHRKKVKISKVETTDSEIVSPVDKLSKSVPTPDSENALPVRVLKRKICRNTLRMTNSVPEREATVSSPSPRTVNQYAMQSPKSQMTVPKQNLTNVRETLRQTGKKKYSKDINSEANSSDNIQGVEELYEKNYEQKIHTLFLNAKRSPKIRAQQMKHSYLHSLKSPMKRKSISICRKSFLLPYNLRRKSVRKSPKKKLNKDKNANLVVSKKPEKAVNDQDVPPKIQWLLDEFPGFEFPKNTLSLLTKQYYQHLGYAHKELRTIYLKKPPTLVQAENTVKQQAMISDLLAKDVKNMNTLKRINDQKACENRIKFSLRDARLHSAALRKYFNEFHSSMKKKLQKRNFTEELIIQETFREMLKLQKEEVQLLCKQVKEADNIDAKHYRQYMCSLQNLYKDQLSMLAESLDAEQRDLLMRMKGQKENIGKLNEDIRSKLQKDVRSLQQDILEAMKDTHFRELDADNFISCIQGKKL